MGSVYVSPVLGKINRCNLILNFRSGTRQTKVMTIIIYNYMHIMIYKKTFINTETLKHAHIVLRDHLREEGERWWASLLPVANS